MEQKDWNAFVLENGPASGAFLQSWGWGEFQTSQGKDCRRLELSGGICQLFETHLGHGVAYAYVPRGPIIKAGEIAAAVLQISHQIAGVAFLRLDLPMDPSSRSTLDVRLTQAAHNIQPPTTILLDLTKSEEELLCEMHEKTRYNIRVATRHGIEVGEGTVDEFLALLHETSVRDQFRAHPDAYYRAMLEDHADPDLKIFLVVARHGGKAIAAALVCDFGKTRTYLHGASSYEDRNLMAPYALQWHLIKEAKAKGLTAYDFWGIAGSDDPREPLAGVTRFKKGWGGEIVRFVPTLDFILKPWQYRAYRALSFVKRHV